MRILFTCGGTGGHIYPAIAIADKIRRRHPDAHILFVGSERGMENTIVPAEGYDIERIPASGFDRRRLLANIGTLRNAMRGSARARDILDRFRTDRVVGTGGYVTAPVIREAAKRGIPAYIHEQNALPGMANRMLERYAEKVFVSYPDSVQAFRSREKIVVTGNPVRREFVSAGLVDHRPALGFSGTDFVVLAFGGSLGAHVLNEEILKMVPRLPAAEIKLVFVTGKRYYEEVAQALSELPGRELVTLIAYAENMPALLSAADLVISRAGALALAEIAVCEKPGILVPSPNVTNDHQNHNAAAFENAGAAIVIRESEFDADSSRLADRVLRLKNSKEKLNAMAQAAFALGRADAADIIYEELNLEAIRPGQE